MPIPQKRYENAMWKKVLKKMRKRSTFVIMKICRLNIFLVLLLISHFKTHGATILTISGSGTGNVGYPTFSGTYVNVTIQFNLPTLTQNNYFESGNLQINYSFSSGQQYTNGRTLSANINSQQNESWGITPGNNQTQNITLNSNTLLNLTANAGQSVSTIVNLTMPTGFDRFTQRGWITVDSSQMVLSSVPEPSILSLLVVTGSLFVFRRRR